VNPFHVFAEENELYETLPKIKVKKIQYNEKSFNLSGPFDAPSDQANFPLTTCYGLSHSTYPMRTPDARDGDPICDSFRVRTFINGAVVCIADGCNWGARPKKASNVAKDTFVSFLEKAALKTIKTVRDAGPVLVNALNTAHNTILEDQNEDEGIMAGSTTFLGGLVLQIDTKEKDEAGWVFVAISVGDCAAYRYSHRLRRAFDVTHNHRFNTDLSDPGGRIGPADEQGNPDLRNLKFVYCLCEPSDSLILMTDGCHDNLDPQIAGKLPNELNWDFEVSLSEDEHSTKNNNNTTKSKSTPNTPNVKDKDSRRRSKSALENKGHIKLTKSSALPRDTAVKSASSPDQSSTLSKSSNTNINLSSSDGVASTLNRKNQLASDLSAWEGLPEDDLRRLKRKYAADLLSQMAQENPTPVQLTQRLLEYCAHLTHKSRTFMEENPMTKMDLEWHKYPGKMDHTTVLVFKCSDLDDKKE
jgi:hypothetical protein